MTDLKKVPRASGASYAAWVPESEIVLCNVPWDNNYRDIVKFKDKAALNKFIDDQDPDYTHVVTNAGYARIDEPIRLRIPIDEAYTYNYIRVRNPEMPTVGAGPTYYYYFITGIAMLTPGVTVFNVSIDVWTTWGDQVSIGRSFVEQGHIGIANENQFQNFGRNYLTVPEGLDTGGEMRVVDWSSKSLVGINNCNIMVVSNTNLSVDPGTKDDPDLATSPGGRVQGVPSGATAYFFEDATSFTNFVSDYQQYPWILQGIMQIVAVPRVIGKGYKMNTVKLAKSARTKCYTMSSSQYGRTELSQLFTDWRGKVQTEHTEARYRNLKKFLVYPYLAVELTTITGTSVIIKPELWRDDNAEVVLYHALTSPGQRSVIAPRHYNGKGGKTEEQVDADGTKVYLHDDGEWIQHATMIGDFPNFAIVNNAGALALAQSAHGRAQQYSSADWSQQKALGSAQTSYDQASAGINNSNYQNELSRSTNSQSTKIANDQAILGALTSGGTGIAMGAATGGAAGAGMGAAGAITGGIGAAVGINGRNRQTDLSNSSSAASQVANAGTAAYMRDTNKDLAQWAARGDYQQSVAAINAKVQDTALTPPFTSGQVGGEALNFTFGDIRVYMHIRQINQDQVAMIGDYWLRYGYAIRRFIAIPESLQVMQNFTYWKLSETYISSGRIPEFAKQAIRGIFEKGVTVWNDPKKIGNIDWADNQPLKGIHY